MTAAPRIPRRRVLQLLAGSLAAGSGLSLATTPASRTSRLQFGDARLQLGIDGDLQTRVFIAQGAMHRSLTSFTASEVLRLASGRTIGRYQYAGHEVTQVEGAHGPSTEYRIRGTSTDGIEKTLLLAFPARHPGVALLRVRFRNAGHEPCQVAGWTVAAHSLPATSGNGTPEFWSFSGASYENRRDWVQPVQPGFEQRNYMGMNASDYGGGTPVVDVWRRDAGLAVGHLEVRPRLVSLPITATRAGARIGVEADEVRTLGVGEEFETPSVLPACARRGSFCEPRSLPPADGGAGNRGASCTGIRVCTDLVRMGLRAQLHHRRDRGHAREGAFAGLRVGRAR